MEEPVVKTIITAVVVVLVASLIGVLLSLIVIGQSILGGGQNKLQSGLTQINQQDLQQYSNVPKKGSIVKSVVALYEGEPIAILIKTTALYKASSGEPASPTTGQGRYVNYGVLLKGATTEMLGPSSNQTQHMVLNAGNGDASSNLRTLAGQAYLEADLNVVNGVPQTNYDTAGIVAVGSLETILDNGLFYSQLIKDKTGTIIGIVFTQQS